VVTDDYLRGLNTMKATAPKQSSTISRSRFDKPEPPSPEKAELAKVTEAVGHTNAHTIQFVDKSKEPREQLKDI
jgi:hypothetical protein